MDRHHLLLSHHSLRFVPFDERVEAAAVAGFDGIGLLIRDYVALVEGGRQPDDLASVVADAGLVLAEIEAVRGWGDGAVPAPAAAETERAFEMAEVFGVRHLTAMGNVEGPLERSAEGFARLCDGAAERGLLVALEPMPIFPVADIDGARSIVEAAGRANGGLCVDSWHLTRGGADWDQLERLPGRLVAQVQIDDGTLEPEHGDYIEDTLANRRACGEGEFDLARFVSTLDGIGADAPFSVEVISAALQDRPAPEVARHLAATTRATLAAARG